MTVTVFLASTDSRAQATIRFCAYVRAPNRSTSTKIKISSRFPHVEGWAMGDEAPELSIPIKGFFCNSNSASTVGILPPNVDPETPIVLSSSRMALWFTFILEEWAMSKARAQRTWVEPRVRSGKGLFDRVYGTSNFPPPNNFMLSRGLQVNRRQIQTLKTLLQ